MQKNAQYLHEAQGGLEWLVSKIQADGSLLGFPRDLACYYKAPTLLVQHGKLDLAHAVLDFIQNHFMQTNGDFLSAKDFKSANTAFGEFWTYTNGWIVQAAQRLGRFDLSYPGWHYLQSYFQPQWGGWKTHASFAEDGTMDVLTTAHLGLLALYMGDQHKGEQAGEYLHTIFVKQPARENRFYLRLNAAGDLITNEPTEMAIFEHVDQKLPNQAYFMMGYPLAFLVKLYQATGESQYLNTAQAYFKWLQSCSGNLRSFFFSHKVAWGASCLAHVTRDESAWELCKTITDYLVSIQESDGSWLSDQDALTHCDQTVEIAIWLTEVAQECV